MLDQGVNCTSQRKYCRHYRAPPLQWRQFWMRSHIPGCIQRTSSTLFHAFWVHPARRCSNCQNTGSEPDGGGSSDGDVGGLDSLASLASAAHLASGCLDNLIMQPYMPPTTTATGSGSRSDGYGSAAAAAAEAGLLQQLPPYLSAVLKQAGTVSGSRSGNGSVAVTEVAMQQQQPSHLAAALRQAAAVAAVAAVAETATASGVPTFPGGGEYFRVAAQVTTTSGDGSDDHDGGGSGAIKGMLRRASLPPGARSASLAATAIANAAAALWSSSPPAGLESKASAGESDRLWSSSPTKVDGNNDTAAGVGSVGSNEGMGLMQDRRPHSITNSCGGGGGGGGGGGVENIDVPIARALHRLQHSSVPDSGSVNDVAPGILKV